MRAKRLVFGLTTLLSIVSFSSSAFAAGDTNVYRLFGGSGDYGDHLYTTNNQEKVANSCPNPGWHLEQVAFEVSDTAANGDIPIERLYNPATDDHFYVATDSSQLVYAKDIGYRDEGIAYYAGGDNGGTPIYRLFNTTTQHHFYTTSTEEMNQAISAGYEYEGTPHSSPADANTPLYRLRNVSDGGYLFTTSTAERDDINCQNPSYSYEGIAFSVYATNTTGNLLPVYRFYSTGSSYGAHHFYTTSQEEYGYAQSSGWSYEGIAFYVSRQASETVWRLSGATQGYLYTADTAEKDSVRFQSGWTLDTTAFNADPPCTSGCTN